MGGKRLIWGDVNAALNRLVAEGVIAAFRTSFGGHAPELGVYVIVTPVERVTDVQAVWAHQRLFMIPSRSNKSLRLGPWFGPFRRGVERRLGLLNLLQQ